MYKRICLLFISLIFTAQVWAASDSTEVAQATNRPSLFEQRRIERQQVENKAAENEVGQPGMLVKMLQGLGVCIGFLLVGAFVYKKFTGHVSTLTGGPHIKVLEKVALSPKISLILAEVDQQRILLGISPEGISALQLLPEAANKAANKSEVSFQQNLELLCVGQKG